MRETSVLIRSRTLATQSYSALPVLLRQALSPALAVAEAEIRTSDAAAGRGARQAPSSSNRQSSIAWKGDRIAILWLMGFPMDGVVSTGVIPWSGSVALPARARPGWRRDRHRPSRPGSHWAIS